MSASWSRWRHLRGLRRHSSTSAKPAEERWVSVFGLEIHAQISSRSKLFCRSPVDAKAPPNRCVGVFDTAHPGTLPVINKRCVEAALLTARALGSRINRVSYFDRKHYFYPDLPAGYQITQERVPIAEGGFLDCCVARDDGTSYVMTQQLDRIQIEEDSGKCLAHNGRILVDLNRAGEAVALAHRVHQTLATLGVCSGRMQDAALRVDANVSINRPGQPLGTRTEVKNINSFSHLGVAIESELARQRSVLEAGGRVVNETRRYDHETRSTVSLRDKEELQDYRFLPEPNLPPLVIGTAEEGVPSGEGALTERRGPPTYCMTALPPSPPIPRVCPESLQTLTRDYGLSLVKARDVMADPLLERHFCAIVALCPSLQVTQHTDTLAYLLLSCQAMGDVGKVEAGRYAELMELEAASSLEAKTYLRIAEEMMGGDDRSPAQIASSHNWLYGSDEALIAKAIAEVLVDIPELLERCRRTSGNPKKYARSLLAIAKLALKRLPPMTNVEEVKKQVEDHVKNLPK